MKKLLLFFLLPLAALEAAQTGVFKSIDAATLNQITDNLKIGAGKTFSGAGTFDFSAGTLTLGAGQVPWVDIAKTGSSLADLATRNASDLTGTLGVTNGGNGLATATLGDFRYGSGTNTLAALAGNTSATLAVLTQTGNGSISAAPVWTSTTGSGNVVLATSPTLVTPVLGAASATAINSLSLGIGGGAIASNIAVGPSTLAANTTGNDNIAIGNEAMLVNTIGFANVAIGTGSMRSVTGLGGGLSGAYNTSVGYWSHYALTIGHENDAFGEYAAHDLTSGIANSSMGSATNRFLTTGTGNSALGHAALYNNVTGSYNVGLGHTAGGGVLGNSFSFDTFVGAWSGAVVTTGSNNAFLGYASGGLVTTGSGNILIGYQAGAANGGTSSSLTTGSNNIVIGTNIDAPTKTADNQLVIANAIYGLGLSGTGTTVSTGTLGLFGNPTGAEKFQVFGASAFNGTVTATSTITSTANGLAAVVTGSNNALLTLSAVGASGGAAYVRFQDSGSDMWRMGYNVAGAAFGLYDMTATAGLAVSFAAGSKNAAFTGSITTTQGQYFATVTGSNTASITLSSVAGSGGSSRIIFADTGSSKWDMGYNVNGGGFQLYDRTATAGNAFAITAGTKDAVFSSVTDATTGGAAGVKSLGGIYATKKIVTASTLTTAAGVAYDFGADVTGVTTTFVTTEYLTVVVGGVTKKIALVTSVP